MKATVFLGGGRITGALVGGLRLAKYARPLLVHDRHPEKLRQLRRRYGVTVERDLDKAIRQAELLIIAVRPGSVAKLLEGIRNLSRPLSAVSLAAGVPLAELRARLGPPVRWARAMPSPVCRSRRGLTALVFDRSLPPPARRKIRNLFSQLGQVFEIPESQFDAFTVTYSASHGYHAVATLARAAQRLGLPRKIALAAATHALADGILAWREDDISLDRLLDEAATPGGISSTVIEFMNRAGYRGAVQQGLAAGVSRARRNRR
jgi:pyrroline-5-carboxylate reductase